MPEHPQKTGQEDIKAFWKNLDIAKKATDSENRTLSEQYREKANDLLEKHPDLIKSTDPKSGDNILHWCVKGLALEDTEDRAEAVKSYLEKGADPFYINSQTKESPLDAALKPKIEEHIVSEEGEPQKTNHSLTLQDPIAAGAMIYHVLEEEGQSPQQKQQNAQKVLGAIKRCGEERDESVLEFLENRKGQTLVLDEDIQEGIKRCEKQAEEIVYPEQSLNRDLGPVDN